MLIRSQFWQVPRVHCNPPRHRGQPGANQGHSLNPFPEERQGGSKANGRMAAFSRFIFRLSDKSHAFFKTLKNPKDFQWTEECESALQELKSYLTTPPLLSKPLLGEVLLLYLAVFEHARRERRPCLRGGKQAATNLLRKQGSPGCGNPL